jgi:hypothetical protein
MSAATAAKTAAAAAASTPANAPRLLLQRACACGGSKSPLGDQCEACQAHALQRKVVIGASDDPYELEADRVADQVLRRKPNPSTPADPVAVQRTPMHPLAAETAPTSVDRTLARAGTPLEPRLRADMETRFAYDFSHVRLHADSTAADSARDVSARAYTVGRDIVFGAGQFAPGSEHGRRLIAHELTHVVQQSAASPLARRRRIARGLSAAASGEPAIQPKLKIGEEDDEYEREADRVAARVMRMPAPVLPAAPGVPDSHGATQTDALGPHQLTDGGTPLPDSLRGFFERRFGRDLSEVRLHSGPHAAARNEQLGAYAFTYGSHVWLGEGQSPAAGYLLAHELAHVIQQRQPRALTRNGSGSMRSTSESRVQRIGGSVPFWVPLGRLGRMTGDELHEEVLGLAQAANADLDTEVNAPNADASGCGPGHHGRIDVYRSTPVHRMPGMYFDAAPDPQKPDAMRVKNFRNVGRGGIASGRFRPYATSAGSKIEGIGEGPTKVELGELKPAAKKMLESGKGQLKNYVCGMRQAAKFTNEWAATAIATGTTKPWNLTDSNVSRLGPSAFTVAPSEPRRLVVADVREAIGGGNKYSVKVREGWVRGTLQVMGRLRVEKDSNPSRPGIWMYYARPENLADLLSTLQSQQIGADITVANSVQNEVIDTLIQAPQPAQPAPPQVAPLRKRGAAGVLQRKPKYDEKPAKFTDNFKLSTWLASQRKLRGQIARPSAALKKQLGALELFEEAYDAEEARKEVPQTGSSSLPTNKKADVIDVVTKADPKTGRKEKKHPRKLGHLLGWLKHWTGIPAEILGVFRAVFGRVFVSIAHLASGIGKSGLFTRIKNGFKTLFDRAKMPSGAIATLMKEGLVFALGKVSDLLLPSVFRMVAGSVKAGIGKALTELFGGDVIEQALEQFHKWKDLVESIEQKVKSALDGVLSFVQNIVAVLQQATAIVDTVKKVQRAIKIGIRLAECAGVWSCLVALASLVVEIDDKIIMQLKDKILSLCNVRSLLAGAVRRLMIDVPVRVANGILSLVHGIIPDSLTPLKTVFSVPVTPEPVPELKEMEDTDCWGIDLGFSLFDEGFSHPKKDGDQKDKKDPKQKEPRPGKEPKDTKGTKQAAPPPPPQPEPRQSSKATPPPPQPAPQTPDQPPPTKTPAKPDPGQADQPAPSPSVRPWDDRALFIVFSIESPVPAGEKSRPVFIEAQWERTRSSQVEPEVHFFCVEPVFVGQVTFHVNHPDFQLHPEPFTPPIVKARLKTAKHLVEKSDRSPTQHPGSLRPLDTNFGFNLAIAVSDKDVLELTFAMLDPDTGKVLLEYTDTLKIKVDFCM